MPDKSYVTMEQHLCCVCGKPYDTGALLLDKRLRERFDRHTITGWGMCEDHQKLYDEGYIALVALDPEKTTVRGGHVKPEDAHRTGVVAHLKMDKWVDVFNSPLPEQDGKTRPMVFADIAVVEMLAGEASG